MEETQVILTPGPDGGEDQVWVLGYLLSEY